MKTFIDFKNMSDGDIQMIQAQLRAQAGQTTSAERLQPTMEEFRVFMLERLTAIQEKLAKSPTPETIGQYACDYDPATNPERFLSESWSVQAPYWALVETPQTYTITMLNLLRFLEFPEDKHLSLVSLGSGPGLYETFLARLLGKTGIGGMTTCIDFASAMTEMHRFILSLEQPPLRNIETATSDMSSIPLPDHRTDVIICNNSLQWCRQWKKAVAEMARILDPDRTAMVYLIIHLHECPMGLFDRAGKCPIEMPRISAERIMDEFEKNKFTIYGSTQMRGGHGSGQMGGEVNRAMLRAKYTPQGLECRWRKAKRTFGEAHCMKWT